MYLNQQSSTKQTLANVCTYAQFERLVAQLVAHVLRFENCVQLITFMYQRLPFCVLVGAGGPFDTLTIVRVTVVKVNVMDI
jgi:hypothetical protein